MSQWKSNANTTGAPKWSASILQQGSGNAAEASNTTSLVTNTTPGTWKIHGQVLHEVDGIFPITPGAKANTSGESGKVHGLGWALRTGGEGGITTLTAANGSIFSNGETVQVTGGSLNAVATLTTNGTGNLVSAAVQTGASAGLFPNTSASGLSVSFTREKHVANLNFSNSTALTNVGNANVINIAIGNTQLSYGVTAFASITSNSTGGITNTLTQAVTWGGGNSTVNWGLFANNQTNTAVVITFTNANGSVVGGTFTATANLVTSTGGAVAVTGLGGRANRVTYEILAVNRHINATATSSVANSTQLPQ